MEKVRRRKMLEKSIATVMIVAMLFCNGAAVAFGSVDSVSGSAAVRLAESTADYAADETGSNIVIDDASDDFTGSVSEDAAGAPATNQSGGGITGPVNGSSDWKWVVTGSSSGLYTLTFEYTGTSTTPPDLKIPDNFYAGIESGLGEVAGGISTIVFPAQTKTIGANAFKDINSITSVSMDNTQISTIGTSAFQNCTSLTGVKFPSTLTEIGVSAFEGNTSMISADFSLLQANTVIYSSNNAPNPALRLRNRAFYGSGLTTLNLPDQLNWVGNEIFMNCENLKTVSMPAFSYFPMGTNDRGSYMFSGCKSLEELSYREISGRSHYYNENTYYFPEYTLSGCYSLKVLDLSGFKDERYSNFQIRNIFQGNSLSALEQLILPASPRYSIYLSKSNSNLGTFQNKTGLSSLNVIKNPAAIGSVSADTFNGSGITAADMRTWTNSSFTTINETTFANCSNLISVIIPSQITTIKSKAFAYDPQLDTVEIHSTKLTSVVRNLFEGSSNIDIVTISSNTKQLTGNLFAGISKNTSVLFQGPNIIDISKANIEGGSQPLKNLNGRHYVDSSGVLYKLDENNDTASVAYIPPEVNSYTVPASITTSESDSNQYTIDSVSPYFCSLAKDLQSLTFEDPSHVRIPASAFSGWTTANNANGKTINGADSIASSDWASVSKLCDYPFNTEDESDKGANLVPAIENIITDSDGKQIVRTDIAVNDKEKSHDNTYDYKTGEKATYTIAISNEDNLIMNKIVRVYFAYDNSGYHMGSFPVGNFSILNSTEGVSYPMSVVETDTPGIYYYEITGVNPGQTLAFKNDVFYGSPNTPGGSLKIWTEALTPDQASAMIGKVINPTDYLQLDWLTYPVTYDLEKTFTKAYSKDDKAQRSGMLKSTPSGDIFITNLAFRIKEKNKEGSANRTEGPDYIRWVRYEDTLELPEGAFWDPQIILAIRKGRKISSDSADGWYIDDSGTTYIDSGSSTYYCRTLKVTANGITHDVAYLYSPKIERSKLLDLTPVVVTDSSGKNLIKLSWRVNNSEEKENYADAEYPVSDFYLRYGDDVLYADLKTVNEIMRTTDENGNQNLLTLNNSAKETRHYSFSENQIAFDGAAAPITADAGLKSEKAYVNTSTPVLAGKEDYMYIKLTNTGIVDLDTWGSSAKDAEGKERWTGRIATDDLSNYFYIQPNDIECMLNGTAVAGTGASAQEWPVGNWLTITIEKASLFTPDQYQLTVGTVQNNKYAYSNNISASADNGRRNYENANIVICKSDGLIEATLTGDATAANNRTYTIGNGADKDYSTIEEFFNAIGYMPTNGTKYKLAWDTDDFSLHAGQSIELPILTTYKNTPMMLTADKETYYSNTSKTVKNEATIYGKVGDTVYKKTISPPTSHKWKYELSLYKEGFIDGSSSSITGDSITLNDGTVVDSHLKALNSNGKAYETISMHDTMTGAQVLLVPVDQNPDLNNRYPELKKYTVERTKKSYYLLNEPGTYSNIVLGSTEKNGTDTYSVDEIIVTKNSSSLNTEIHWQAFVSWGGTSTPTNIWYKSLVSAEKAGLLNPGEEAQGSYSINNKAWLGDHQGHRLYDTMSKSYRMYSFIKSIVTDDGKKDGTDTRAAGTLTDYSRVSNGKTVTYQIEINNTSPTETTLRGSNIYDLLPDTIGKFEWTRGDVERGLEANVKNLRYFASTGVNISYGTGENKTILDVNGGSNENRDDYWSIRKRNDNPNLYEIRWDNDFAINFPTGGNVKILVDVTFPDRSIEGVSTWDQFLSATNGEPVYNYFYLNGISSKVKHSLAARGKPVLYKGVYDTGVTTRSQSDPTNSYYCTYTSGKSRLMYANGPGNSSYNDSNLKASTVTYYTVLYNGSYDRMYLSDLQDRLPKGFSFNSFANYAYNTTSSYNTDEMRYVGYSGTKTAYPDNTYHVYEYTEYPANYYSSYALVDIDNSGDEHDNNTIRYVNARVKMDKRTDDKGYELLTFSFVGAGTNYANYPALKFDKAVEKYYLDPGEAVRICYNAEVGPYADTTDLATNTVSMPYYDYYGLGFDLHVPDEDNNGGAVQKVRAMSGVTNNDGGCRTMKAEAVAKEYGFVTSSYQDEKYKTQEDEGGNWLVSEVTVERAKIVPGIQKTVGGLTVKPESITTTTILGSKGNDASLFGSKYSGGCQAADIVNWSVRVFSEGYADKEHEYVNDKAIGSLENYTIRDTVANPYGFTGQVFYNLYRATNSGAIKVNSASQYLFTIGPRGNNDVTVTIGKGGSIGTTELHIGSAEDDTDDKWFEFGTGNKSGKVKIERKLIKPESIDPKTGKKTDAVYQEVMTIELIGSAYGVPPWCWADFCIHTQYTKSGEVVLSEGKYNDVILTPEQDYDPQEVAQGRARTKQIFDVEGNLTTKNDGVQSGASVMLTQGYNTESWKEITETGTNENARSDSSVNYVKLDEKTNTFRYDLYMVAPQAVMSKLVMIDDLPQKGDHSSFVEEEKRNSEYKVGFLEDDLDFKVLIAAGKGKTERQIDKKNYKLYISEKTEFNQNDWEAKEPEETGEGDDTKEWIDITDKTGEELAEVLEDKRSFRLVIEDPKAWTAGQKDLLMSRKSQIHLSFNAKVDDATAEPGTYAWNSFGYKYEVPLTFNGSRENSTSFYLGAQPLNVGVKFPSAPELTKKLTQLKTEEVEITDEETGITTTETRETTVARKAPKDIKFGFIVYKGEHLSALDNAVGMNNAEIATALEGIEYFYVPLTVEKGKSSGTLGLWTVDYCSKYVAPEAGSDGDGTFEEDTERQWKWVNNQKYTIVEIDKGNDGYSLTGFTIGKVTHDGNNVEFTNNSESKISISATNNYTAAGKASVKGVKNITNRTFRNGDSWNFKLSAYKADPEDPSGIVADPDAPMPASDGLSIHPGAGGKLEPFDFGLIRYTLDDVGKTYHYRVTESGEVENVVNDKEDHLFSVSVYDNGDGTLGAAVMPGSDGLAIGSDGLIESDGLIVSDGLVIGRDGVIASDGIKLGFNNIYKAAGGLLLKGKKSIDSRALEPGDRFEFTLSEKFKGKEDKLLQTVTNEEDGSISFEELRYDLDADHSEDEVLGDHIYTIRERRVDAKGITSDSREYDVTVNVTNNEDEGALRAAVTDVRLGSDVLLPSSDGLAPCSDGLIGSDGIVSGSDGLMVCDFVNRYEAKGDITFAGRKTIDGRELLPGEEYEFTVVEKIAGKEDRLIQTVKNGADGSIAFKPIEYVLDSGHSDLGKHRYEIREKSTDGNGITTDKSVYTVTVEVTDNKDGTLKAEMLPDEDSPGSGGLFIGSGGLRSFDFVNTFEAEGSIKFKGTKTIDSRGLAPDEKYEFTVSENGRVIQTVENEPDGTIPFEEIKYEHNSRHSDVGEHVYTIKETRKRGDGIRTDSRVYTVKVEVTDNKDGTLTPEIVSRSVDAVPDSGGLLPGSDGVDTGSDGLAGSDGLGVFDFVNSYEADGSIRFEGLKTIDCRDLEPGEHYEFTLSENGEVIQTVENGPDGRISFDRIYYFLNAKHSDLGEHIYTIRETEKNGKGITTDTRVYTITVNVIDNMDGTLSTVIVPQVDDISPGSDGLVESDGLIESDGVDAGSDGLVESDGLDTGSDGLVESDGLIESDGLDIRSDGLYGISFVNKYEATGDITFEGTKTIIGRDMGPDDVYEFTVSENGEVIQTVHNDPDGRIEFEKIEYILNAGHSDLGEHIYTIRETETDENGIKSDIREFIVRVKVTDNKDGTLRAVIVPGDVSPVIVSDGLDLDIGGLDDLIMDEPIKSDGVDPGSDGLDPSDGLIPSDGLVSIDFVNRYGATGEIPVIIRKELKGREWKQDDVFEFELRAVDGAPMPESANGGDTDTIRITYDTYGKTEFFGPIRFTKEDLRIDGRYVTSRTFRYEIRELIPANRDQNMTYDENTYIAEIIVTDDGKGDLNTEISYSIKDSAEKAETGDGGELIISNTYEEPPSDNPPSDDPPSDNPPSDDPPSDDPPSDDPPSVDPPSDDPPSDDPPSDDPPSRKPPKDPPKKTPPKTPPRIRTGDENQMAYYIVTMTVALAALILLLRRRLRK